MRNPLSNLRLDHSDRLIVVFYIGAISTVGQITLWFLTDRFQLALLTFTGGLMLVNRIDKIAGGGGKG